MKVFLKPLYSKLNTLEGCPLGCQEVCQVSENSELKAEADCTCPLRLHQAKTYAEVTQGSADIIFNRATTGDGKSLAAYLPGLLDSNFRVMGLYPTIELVEDQDRSHRDKKDGKVVEKGWHSLFYLNAEERIDRLFGEELSRRVQDAQSNRFQELRIAIENKPFILTNPDIFHLITHFQYQDPAYGNAELPALMADFPKLWVFDEFHIFGPHQEAAVLNSLSFIRQSRQEKPRFLFTSATPKDTFIQQLKAAGFNPKVIPGHYANSPQAGYCQILQRVKLDFVQLKGQDVLEWLRDCSAEIHAELTKDKESPGRGLIILNSVAQAGRAVKLLKDLPLFSNVEVWEISGRMDRTSRQATQDDLKNSPKPVLVIGTSAVDVGVDFKIHLLIFETSDSATVIQRLGRLGRHSGFKQYKAIALLPEYAPWILARLQQALPEGEEIDRQTLRDAIIDAFDVPKEFDISKEIAYRREWGALQAQGMLWHMSKGSRDVMAGIRDRILQDLKPVYESRLESARWCWEALSRIDPKKVTQADIKRLESGCKCWTGLCQVDVGKATQKELLRFRGSTTVQAAVWDENRFYTYDLLRLLPYTSVEVLEEAEFLEAARRHGYQDFLFQYAQAFLRVHDWVSERINIRLRCGYDSSELKCCDLTLLGKIKIDNHPQSDVIDCLSRKQILGFLVPEHPQRVRDTLKLGSLFGLYHFKDSSEKVYACAFNQDALLLQALRGKLTRLCRQNTPSLFF